jgi:hypothetical protein
MSTLWDLFTALNLVAGLLMWRPVPTPPPPEPAAAVAPAAAVTARMEDIHQP